MLKASYNMHWRDGKYDKLLSSAHGLKERKNVNVLYSNDSFGFYVGNENGGRFKKDPNLDEEYYDVTFEGRPYKLKRSTDDVYHLYGIIDINGKQCVNFADEILVGSRPGVVHGIQKGNCACYTKPPEDFAIYHPVNPTKVKPPHVY